MVRVDGMTNDEAEAPGRVTETPLRDYLESRGEGRSLWDKPEAREYLRAVRSEVPVAQAIFAAQIAMGLAEERVMELLDATFGEDGWSEWTADYYDESIEVYEIEVGPEPDVLSALAAAGFAQTWLHEHERDPSARCACPVHYLRNREPRQ